MRKIVLLTKQYPFGNREQFLDSELKFCDENNIDIDLISTCCNENEKNIRDLPSKIHLRYSFNSHKVQISDVLRIFRVSKSHEYKAEVQYLKKYSIYSKYKNECIFRFLIKAFKIVDTLEKIYSYELKNNPQDLVFYSYWMEESACAAAILKKKYGCVAISRTHGYDLYLERHKENYISMQKWLVENLTAICPVSDTGKLYLEDKYYPSNKIRTEKLATEDYGLSPEYSSKFTIVSCSNVIPLKRVELIAKAMSLINVSNVKWIHFGDGSSFNLVKDLVSMCKNVECCLMGRKNHEEIFDFYRNNHVDLFINVSTTEGLPVSIMECISFGIPVLATNVGGTHEIVIDGKNGKLLDSDISAEVLAVEILAQINLSEGEKKLQRKNARDIWERDFNYKQTYKKFYNSIL